MADHRDAVTEKDTSKRKKGIYDGIRISKEGADKIVFILSLSLVIMISVAIILAGAR